MNVAGRTAVWRRVRNLGESISVEVRRDETVYLISAYPADSRLLAVFEQMLQTFEFVAAVEVDRPRPMDTVSSPIVIEGSEPLGTAGARARAPYTAPARVAGGSVPRAGSRSSGWRIGVSGSGDNLSLKIGRRLGEVGRVAGHADRETAVLFRPLDAGAQILVRQDVGGGTDVLSHRDVRGHGVQPRMVRSGASVRELREPTGEVFHPLVSQFIDPVDVGAVLWNFVQKPLPEGFPELWLPEPKLDKKNRISQSLETRRKP